MGGSTPAWKHEGRPLKELFHALCRPRSEPSLCAYCDGALRATSGETIDHFLPKGEFPELWLSWHNLFPACHLKAMRNAWKRDAKTLERDHSTAEEYATKGPYRFVARRFLEAVPASTRKAALPAR
jgi:uncharacterized protein (TIGR02646 family)